MSDNYEEQLKGYIIGDKEKDEITPSTTEETRGAYELISFIKDSLERSYSKISLKQTKLNLNGQGEVGGVKYLTCGSYREFKFHQDNEDGGWTNTSNFGASSADGNRNMNWSFCLVPGHERPLSPMPDYNPSRQPPIHYGGGVLLLYKYRYDNWNSSHGNIDIVYRYHDDEDHSNRNGVSDMGGQIWDAGGKYLGESYFGGNTGLTWRFSDKPRNFGLPFRYGVLTNDFNESDGFASIDDENGSNINYAVIHRHKIGSSGPESREVRGRKERFRGVGIWDTNTGYFVQWYN